jgi:hypothetical protein|tara:strand:+ start:662 stop:868 length:207 start_codon:yes stop_codon:yes gene_type:complete
MKECWQSRSIYIKDTTKQLGEQLAYFSIRSRYALIVIWGLRACGTNIKRSMSDEDGSSDGLKAWNLVI